MSSCKIIIHFLGAIYTDRKGRISISAYQPTFGGILIQEFSDEKKIFSLNIDEDTAQIINKVTVYCKKSASWSWSNDTETTDDIYAVSNSTSITNYGLKNPFVWKDLYWHSVSKAAQQYFADRLVDKYAQPPLEINFETGLDGTRIDLADRIKFTDSRML